MSRALILDSLEIRRFRCFQELRIGRLGPVNLIVGKNNVGKSTLLEALRLYARPAVLADFLEILVARNEMSAEAAHNWTAFPISRVPIDSLFFGRRSADGPDGALIIGPLTDPEKRLQITVEPVEKLVKRYGVKSEYLGFDQDEAILTRQNTLVFRMGSAIQRVVVSGLGIRRLDSDPIAVVHSSTEPRPTITPLRLLPSYSIGPNCVGLGEVGRLWDGVALAPLEQDVINALRVISPDVARLALKVPDDSGAGRSSDRGAVTRIPYVKLDDLDEPIPLRALGDGVNRLFGLALALVHAKGGILLVDEIENGIHYSVQTNLWHLVFEMAARLDVQVFATTHSYDCIKAFEAAASESDEEGVLVRLARKGDRTLVGEFDESELGVAVEGQIEVR